MFEIAGQRAARLRDTTRRLFDLAFLDVAGRMAHTLINLTGKREAAAGPRGVTIRTSRQELARLVGCSREMAGRVLKRSEEHTSELQSLMRISYAVFCLKKKRKHKTNT